MKRAVPAILSFILLAVGYTVGMMLMESFESMMERKTARAIETMGE